MGMSLDAFLIFCLVLAGFWRYRHERQVEREERNSKFENMRRGRAAF